MLQGRSAVHLAASVDRYAILEWLLNQVGGIVVDFKNNLMTNFCFYKGLHNKWS